MYSDIIFGFPLFLPDKITDEQVEGEFTVFYKKVPFVLSSFSFLRNFFFFFQREEGTGFFFFFTKDLVVFEEFPSCYKKLLPSYLLVCIPNVKKFNTSWIFGPPFSPTTIFTKSVK